MNIIQKDESITELSSYLIEKQIYSGQRQIDSIITTLVHPHGLLLHKEDNKTIYITLRTYYYM